MSKVDIVSWPRGVIKYNAVFYDEQLIGYELGQFIWEGRSKNDHISAVHLHPGGRQYLGFAIFCGGEWHKQILVR